MTNKRPTNTPGPGCALVLGLIATPPLWLYEAWVVTRLWDWFISPAFDTPGIGMATALGIALLISLLTHQYQDTSSEDPYAGIILRSVHSIMLTTWALVLGWLTLVFIA